MSALRRWWECRVMRGPVMAYLDGEPADAARVQRHLARCPACREFARMHAAQARAIEMLPAEEDPPAEFVDRVMQRIAVPEPRPMRTRVSLRPAFAAVSAAAAVAIIAAALWLGVLQSNQTRVVRVSPRPAPARVADAVERPAPTQDVTPTATPAPTPEPPSAPVIARSVRTASAAKVIRPQVRSG
jgi:anti-sigma factor RsiW